MHIRTVDILEKYKDKGRYNGGAFSGSNYTVRV